MKAMSLAPASKTELRCVFSGLIAMTVFACTTYTTSPPIVEDASSEKSTIGATSPQGSASATVPSANTASSTIKATQVDREQDEWTALNAQIFGFCGGDSDFEAFLKKYPTSRFKPKAMQRMKELKLQCEEHRSMVPSRSE